MDLTLGYQRRQVEAEASERAIDADLDYGESSSSGSDVEDRFRR